LTIRLHPLSRARVRSGTPAEGLVEYAWGHRWPRRPAGTGDAICPASVANSRSHSAYCSACHAWRSSTYGSRTVCSAVAACASAARTQPCSTESVHAAGDGGYIRTLRTGASVTPGYSGIFWDILGYMEPYVFSEESSQTEGRRDAHPQIKTPPERNRIKLSKTTKSRKHARGRHSAI